MTLLTPASFKQSATSYLPIHQLLAKKDLLAWRHSWYGLENAEDAIAQLFPHYVAALTKVIIASQAKRVFLLHSDRAYFLAGFLATLQVGIPVVLPPSGAPDLLKELMQPDDCLLTNQQELGSKVPSLIAMHHIAFADEKAPKFPILDPNNSRIIFYTSGSTGRPKQVSKSLQQLEAEIAVLENTWGGDRDLVVSTVSQQHIYGLLFSLLWPICSGYPLKRTTFSFWEELLADGTDRTVIVSSPSHLGRFPLSNKAMSGIKQVFSSGSLLSFAAAQQTSDLLGVLPIEIYGSTETGGIAYRQQQQKSAPWTCFSSVKIKTEANQTLCIQSSYLPNPRFYKTQDHIALVNPNRFHLIGRADRVVKVEGKRVSLLSLEQKLNALPYIQEVAVVVLASKTRDELGAIAILSTQGQNQLSSLGKIKFLRQIRQSLRNYFDLVAIPKKWRFVAKLPINQQGKRTAAMLQDFFKQEE
jgi:acyl-coenzyme A synthetase/AMP-(fatty) acid ligase